LVELLTVYMQGRAIYGRDRYGMGPRPGFPTLPG